MKDKNKTKARLIVELEEMRRRISESEENKTERKQAEEALRVSLVKYKTLFDSLPLGITVADQTGKIFEINRMAEKLLGLSSEDQKKRKISGEYWRIIRPDGTPMPAEEYASVRALKENRLVENVEMGVYKAAGDIVWISVTAAPIPLETPGVVITYIDISERKQQEAKRLESETRYRELFENSPTSLWEQDFSEVIKYLDDLEQSGERDLDEFLTRNPEELFKCADLIKVNKVNSASVKLFKAGTDAELKETIGAVFSEESLPVFQKSLLSIAEGNESFESECVLQTLDKERLVTILKWSKLGKRVIVSIQDITERKKVEENIKQALAEKEVLFKEIHHRVKNNLTIITSLLNLQSNTITNKEQALAAFEDSRNRIYSMALVHEQLYKSSDFLNIEMKPFIEILSLELRQANTSQKDIVLELVGDNIVLGVGLAIPCGLILNELISNAYKHAFSGKKTGHIKISLRLLKEKSYELSVQDNGAGLPDEIDINNSKTLGLQLVNMLTKQIEGKLEIRREKGTTFILRF